MTTLGIIFLCLVAYAILRRGFNKVLTQKYSYKLFDLRDELRQGVIDGRIKKNDARFLTIDKLIGDAAKNTAQFNYWSIKFRNLKLKHDPNFYAMVTTINALIRENEFLAEIQNKYTLIIVKYLIWKHIWLSLVFLIYKVIQEISKMEIEFIRIPDFAIYNPSIVNSSNIEVKEHKLVLRHGSIAAVPDWN